MIPQIFTQFNESRRNFVVSSAAVANVAIAQARNEPNRTTSARLPLAIRCAKAQRLVPSTIGGPTLALMWVPGT